MPSSYASGISSPGTGGVFGSGIEIALEISRGRPSGSFRQEHLRRLDGADLLRGQR